MILPRDAGGGAANGGGGGNEPSDITAPSTGFAGPPPPPRGGGQEVPKSYLQFRFPSGAVQNGSGTSALAISINCTNSAR